MMKLYLLLAIYFISCPVFSLEFEYDRDVAHLHAKLISNDIFRLDRKDISNKYDFNKNIIFSIKDTKNRRFVVVAFSSKNNFDSFVVVSEICGVNGLGFQHYFLSDAAEYAGSISKVKEDYLLSSKDSTFALPIGCPGWYTDVDE